MISLVPYDATWPASFADEAARLRSVCGPGVLRIDHVGSTSIPGLEAKPIIDVQITVDTLAPLIPWVSRLVRLGYTHHPSPDDIEYPFFHRPTGWPHTHHVHLCLPASRIGRATLALRDYLRDHPAERDAYAIEKRRLAAQHVGDAPARREAYALAKSPFLEPLIARAFQLGYPRG
jgi:GrpB-like predicted nucleotidyltransferase (UPF0157 family)